MHAAVHFLLLEAGMILKGMLSAVLEDEVTARMEEVLREHLVGKGIQAFQGVGKMMSNFSRQMGRKSKTLSRTITTFVRPRRCASVLMKEAFSRAISTQ